MNITEFIAAMKMVKEGYMKMEEDGIAIEKMSLDRVDWKTKSMIIMEELAELSQQVSKGVRDDRPDSYIYSLLEEIADVVICMDFLVLHYGIDPKDLECAVKVKLIREYNRCKESNKQHIDISDRCEHCKYRQYAKDVKGSICCLCLHNPDDNRVDWFEEE